MVKVPYRGVPKKDTVEVKGEGAQRASDPPIRKGEVKSEAPPIRRAVRTGEGG